jgi:hypothetical protein
MLVASLLMAQLTAVAPSYADAKAQADQYEALLLPKDSATLVEAQAKALEAALLVCGPAPRRGAPVTLVVQVGRDGLPMNTWRKGESTFAVCIEDQLASARLPVATGKAFHTSYELSFAP